MSKALHLNSICSAFEFEFKFLSNIHVNKLINNCSKYNLLLIT